MTGTYQTIQNTLVGLVGLMSLMFCADAVLTAPGPRRPDCRNPDPPSPSRLAADRLGAHRHNLRLLQPVPARQHRAGTLARRRPQRGEPSGKPPGHGMRSGPRRPHHGGGCRLLRPAPRPGCGRGQRRRSCRPAGPGPRRSAPVFFGLGLFAAGLTSAITAPLAAAYAVSGALGWPPDLRSGRFRLLWGLVLATGVVCAVTLGGAPYQVILLAQAGNGIVAAADADPAAHGRQQDRDHGTPPQLTACQCAGRHRRTGDLGAVADATGPGAGACRIATDEEPTARLTQSAHHPTLEPAP